MERLSGTSNRGRFNERDQSPVDRRVYADAENAARASRVGLWADAKAVPPWEYRRQKK